MISALTSSDYKNIIKISVLDAKRVFYPLKFVLQKRDIVFDKNEALVIKNLIPEDLRFPGTAKITDSGMLRDYKFEVSINNQFRHTEEQLESFENKKVIYVLHHNYGKIILGCNELPFDFSFSDDNTVNPASDSGFTITGRGTSYFTKVST